MPPYCRGSKHQKNGLAPLEERKRLCDPPNLPNLISVICLFPINMQPLALFLRKEPGGLSSISNRRIAPVLRLLTNPAEKPLGLYANWKKIEKNRRRPRIKDPPWGPLFLFQRSKAIFLMFWQTAVRRHCSVTLASPLIRA